MTGRQTAIDGDRLAVYVGCAVTQQETGHLSNLLRLSGACGRIDLADAIAATALVRQIESGFSHAGFNQSRADGIHSDAGSIQLISAGLGNTDHTRFAGTVVNATGIG